MRWVAALLFIPFGCDPFAETPAHPAARDPGAASGGDSGGMIQVLYPPGDIDLGGSYSGPIEEPVPSSEWCAEAARHDVLFCEVVHQDLEFCEAAERESNGAGGAESSGGAEAGGGAHGGAESAGGAGGGASPAGGQGCAVPDPSNPPFWVYELLLQCEGQCSVRIWPSARVLDGACCYLARGVFGGR